MRTIDRCWRCVGTAVFLALIGLGGSALALTVFPLISWLTDDKRMRQARIQRVMHVSLRLYCRLIHLLRIADVHFAGTEQLRGLKATLIVANHPSLLDVVMIMAAVPNVQCIVKAALWKHLFFRLTVEGAGYIPNDLDPDALLEACVDTLREGNNLIVFPEGTRTVRGRPFRVRRGFARIALTANVNIQLVTITCEPPVLHKGNPWWRVPEKRSVFRMQVGNMLDIHEFVRYQEVARAARNLATTIENYYTERVVDGPVRDRSQTADYLLPEARGSLA
ncbi:MAG: 1-acyl-sn-glycerol-3-phosphate acyltransferase [Acetobacteraceae bacterium]|nr:1-acyl-sn-glycerol-3-phosphate acyltransferase [Acetobacteraceae bacterium]